MYISDFANDNNSSSGLGSACDANKVGLERPCLDDNMSCVAKVCICRPLYMYTGPGCNIMSTATYLVALSHICLSCMHLYVLVRALLYLRNYRRSQTKFKVNAKFLALAAAALCSISGFALNICFVLVCSGGMLSSDSRWYIQDHIRRYFLTLVGTFVQVTCMTIPAVWFELAANSANLSTARSANMRRYQKYVYWSAAGLLIAFPVLDLLRMMLIRNILAGLFGTGVSIFFVLGGNRLATILEPLEKIRSTHSAVVTSSKASKAHATQIAALGGSNKVPVVANNNSKPDHAEAVASTASSLSCGSLANSAEKVTAGNSSRQDEVTMGGGRKDYDAGTTTTWRGEQVSVPVHGGSSRQEGQRTTSTSVAAVAPYSSRGGGHQPGTPFSVKGVSPLSAAPAVSQTKSQIPSSARLRNFAKKVAWWTGMFVSGLAIESLSPLSLSASKNGLPIFATQLSQWSLVFVLYLVITYVAGDEGGAQHSNGNQTSSGNNSAAEYHSINLGKKDGSRETRA